MAMAEIPQDDPVFRDMVECIRTADAEGLEALLQADDKKTLWLRLNTFSVSGEFKGQTLLHIAADLSRNRCVRAILSKVRTQKGRAKLCNTVEENQHGRIPLHTVLDGGCRCEDCTAKNVDCVTVLLEAGSNVNARDREGDTPLFYAVEFMMADCAAILVEHGADANVRFVPLKDRKKPGGGKKIILYKHIAQKIPSALSALLDKGISPSKADSAVLNLDFKLFLQVREKSGDEGKGVEVTGRETDILMCMAEAHSAGKQELLTHPMTMTFLHFKWTLVRRFILFVQLSYFVLTTLYTLYVLEVMDFRSDEDEEATPEPDKRPREQELDHVPENGLLADILVYFVCLWMVFMILNELYEISLGFAAYLKVGLNYAWWILILCVGVTIPPGFNVEVQLWQLPIAAFAVFLSWGLTLVQTSRFPSLGIYIEMLGKVVTDFAIFVVTFAALLVGFALAFHVLFPEDVMFSNVATAFVAVILLMVGETQYENIFEEVMDPDQEVFPLEYTIPAHILFVGFIFVITIVLMNLLLGLAVSDIQELKKVATVLRVKRQIEQIQLFEALLLGKFWPQALTDFGMKYFSIMRILNSYDLESETSIIIHPTDPQYKVIPKELKELLIPYVLETPCINPEALDIVSNTQSAEEEQHLLLQEETKQKRKLEVRDRLERLEGAMTEMQRSLANIQQLLQQSNNH